MKKVKVIDSLMGTGKTSYAIQTMQEAPLKQKFIYVTPFLDEVSRIKDAVSSRSFKEPEHRHGSGKKLLSLKRLISKGKDIATTHALFALADDELMELLKGKNYILILDEVMDVMSQLNSIRRHDIPVLLDSGRIEIDNDSKVIWKGNPLSDTQYNEVMVHSLAGNLYAVKNIALVWTFPAKIFSLFKEVYILTYLFKGQLQCYYYDLHDIHYKFYSVTKQADRYKLEPRKNFSEDRTLFKELIRIYEGNLNDIGNKENALSNKWFVDKENKEKVKQLKNNQYNYFRNIMKAKSGEILWTAYKGEKDNIRRSLQGKGFSKLESDNKTNLRGDACFTPFNLRATNRYSHKSVLAFLLNRFPNPIEKQFFNDHHIKVNDDLLALSDLLQWIFRSAIRQGNPIAIYIPSKRMRNLLESWLDSKI